MSLFHRQPHVLPMAVRSAEQAEALRRSQEFAAQQDSRLARDASYLYETMQNLLGDRQSKTITLGGLKRVTTSRLGGVLNTVLVGEAEELGGPDRVTVACSQSRQSFVEVDEHFGDLLQGSYKFVSAGGSYVLGMQEAQLPLSHPMAQQGLERLAMVCMALGQLCEHKYPTLVQ